MDYLCGRFSDFTFSRFGFIVRTDRQNHRITEAHDCYIHATTVDMSNGGGQEQCADRRDGHGRAAAAADGSGPFGETPLR